MYPRERLEILVVDDGSTDDTWDYISQAARRYSDLVIPIRLEKNCGKKMALGKAVQRALGVCRG